MMLAVEPTPAPDRTPPGDYEATVRVLHRAPPAEGVTSPPLLIRDGGFVHDQARWRGLRYLVQGFASVEAPDERVVNREEWLAEPQSGVGLRAVFMSIDGDMVTDRVEVEAVTEQTVTLRDPWSAILRSTVSASDPETLAVGEQIRHWDVPVGDLLDLLTPDIVARAEGLGWKRCRAASDLSLLSGLSRGPEAMRALAEYFAATGDGYDVQEHVFGPAVGIEPPEDYQPPG